MCNSKNEKIMKKIIFSIMALAALFACQKENFEENAPGETVTVIANVDGADTKTVLNETTKYSQWVSGDKITIHNGTKGFEFATTQSGKSAEFSYAGNDFAGNKFMAVYPAGDYTVDMAARTVNAYIPTWQQAQKRTYHSSAALAVAYSETDAFMFRNATALLKFTVNADKVTHVIFHGNNGEALTGNVKVSLSGSSIKSVECLDTEFTTGEGENQTVETKKGTWVECYAYHDDENKYFVKGETYYMAVAPVELTQGATVKFKINDGEEIEVRKTSNSNVISANQIINLGELKYDAPERDPWTVAGTFNDWKMYDDPMTLEGDIYVYRGISGLNFTAQDDAEDKSSKTGFQFIQDGTSWRGGYGDTDTPGKLSTNSWSWYWKDNGKNIYVEGASATDKFDVYLNPETEKFVIVTAGSAMPEDTPAVETDDVWGVIGDCVGSAWANDIEMEKSGDMFVARDVEFAEEGEFKIRANKTWENNDAKNIGVSEAGKVKAGYYYAVIAGGGSGNMTVAAGTYDIWFDFAGMKVYVMAPDADPSTAAEGEVEIPEVEVEIPDPDTTVPFTFILDNDNHKEWWGEVAYLYVWDASDNNNKIKGDWPGKAMVYEASTFTFTGGIPKEYVGKELNFIVHNGNGWQTKDSKMTVKNENTFGANSLQWK